MSTHEDGKAKIAEVVSGVENCRAKKLINSEGYELVMCLMNRPFCDHVIVFGYNLLLCNHPRRMEIVEKKKAADG